MPRVSLMSYTNPQSLHNCIRFFALKVKNKNSKSVNRVNLYVNKRKGKNIAQSFFVLR